MPRRPDESVNEDAVREFREVFNLIDKDNDGRISVAELGSGVRSLGGDPNDADLKEVVQGAKVDSNGLLDCNEFVRLMGLHMSTWDFSTEVLETFKGFDKEGTGRIPSEALEQILRSLGDELTEEEVQQMIREAQAGDNCVDYVAFARFLCAAAGPF